MGNIVKAFTGGLLKAGSLPLPKYFTAEEVNQILEANKKDQQTHLILHLLWKTGVRASELVELRWQDVNFYDKHVRVVTLKKSRQKRKGRRPVREHERIIPIDDALLSELLLWRNIQEQKASKSTSLRRRERLLTYVTAVGYTRIYKLVRKAVLLAGFDEDRAHPHTFRHSFAVHLLKQGVPITVVQQLLGHSSIENTMIYTLIVQQEAMAFLRDVKW